MITVIAIITFFLFRRPHYQHSVTSIDGSKNVATSQVGTACTVANTCPAGDTTAATCAACAAGTYSVTLASSCSACSTGASTCTSDSEEHEQKPLKMIEKTTEMRQTLLLGSASSISYNNSSSTRKPLTPPGKALPILPAQPATLRPLPNLTTPSPSPPTAPSSSSSSSASSSSSSLTRPPDTDAPPVSLMHSINALGTSEKEQPAGCWTLSMPPSAAGPKQESITTTPSPSTDIVVDDAIVAKCTRLLKMGVPSGAILAKLRADGIEAGIAERALNAAGGGSGAPTITPPPVAATPAATLSTLGLEPGLAASLEVLFAPRVKTTALPAPATASAITAVTGPVSVLDARRAMQVGIGLARFRGVPRATMRAALETLTPVGLTAAQCIILESLAPSPTEASAVVSAAAILGERRLGDAEAFFLELAVVPRVRERAEALAFRVSASTRLSNLAERVAALRAAADALSADSALQRIATVASALIIRTATTGNAAPFSLLSLLALKGSRLPAVPFRDPRGTLLHLLAAVLDRTDAEAAKWEVPPAVIAATGAELSGLALELDTGVRIGAAKFREILNDTTTSPPTAVNVNADDENDANVPAQIFADKHEAATARLAAALLSADNAWAHAWRAFSLPPLTPAPPPEGVFASLTSFAAALQRCRLDMAQAEIETGTQASSAGKSSKASA